ncbi:MAG: flippase [Candidatus Pacebacteria bacterium]|nr:flippase [Candidatus Paceibacterota bacterium]
MNLIKLKSFLFENKTSAQTITKNSFWLFLGQMVSRALRAILVIYSARVLGVSGWGAFSYALGIVTMLTVFSDFGINALITRQGANQEKRDQYIVTSLGIKIGLIIILSIGAIFFAQNFAKLEEAKIIIPLLLFVFIFDTLRDLGSAITRSMEKMQIESALNILTNASILIFGILFLYKEASVSNLAIAYSLGSLIGFSACFFILRKNFTNLKANFKPELIIEIIKSAWPYGMLIIMGIVMLNTDIIILGSVATAEAVGYYSSGQKLIQLLYVIPTLIGISAFPQLARFAQSAPEKARAILKKTVLVSVLMAVFFVSILLPLSKFIIQAAFGDQYLKSIPVFQILIFSLLVVFPSSILGQAIFAYKKERYFIWISLVTILGNALLDLILIPKYGIEGAAYATLIMQTITGIFLIAEVNKITGSIIPSLKSFRDIFAKEEI